MNSIDRRSASGSAHTGLTRIPVAARLTATLFVTLACALTWSARAHAATPLSWSGASSSPDWSQAANWSGGAPTTGATLGDVSFGDLGSACNSGSQAETCYTTSNDLTGLTLAGLNFDNDHPYTLAGDGFTLGSDGINASSETTPMDYYTAKITAPITLDADQTWAIGNATNGGSAIIGSVSGDYALDIVNGSAEGNAASGNEQFDGNVNVGPLTVQGGGSLTLTGRSPQQVNYASGNTVTVDSGASLYAPTGTLEFGPLDVNGGTVQLGQSDNYGPQTTLQVNGTVTLSGGTQLSLFMVQPGSTPGLDFSSLEATQSIDIEDASLSLTLGSDAGDHFHELQQGVTYTLISTQQSLTGTFAGLPDGSTVTIYDDDNGNNQTGTIHYTSDSVTVTVTSGPTTAALQNVEPPVITGKPTVGSTLTVSNGTWNGTATSYSYQWYDCGTNSCASINGATGQSYTVNSNDLNYYLMATVTATNAGGPNYANSALTGPVADPPPHVVWTAAMIRSALRKAMAVSGKAARKRAVLAAGGYRTRITAPVEAHVRIQWTIVRRVKGKRSTVLVATTNYPLVHGGATQAMKISLTSAGRRLLRSSRGALKLTATGRFVVDPTNFVVTLSSSVTLTA